MSLLLVPAVMVDNGEYDNNNDNDYFAHVYDKYFNIGNGNGDAIHCNTFGHVTGIVLGKLIYGCRLQENVGQI